MKKILFLDESGKTGSMRFDGKKMLWNYNDQPYFALCGIAISDSTVKALQDFVEETRKKYNIQGELKASKSKVQQNAEKILTELFELLKKHQCNLYIEIVDKKFCISTMIVEYFILPYYDSPMCVELTMCKRAVANELYHIVSDDLLCKITTFFDENTQDIQKLLSLCELLRVECKNHQYLLSFIDETMDSILQYESLGLKKRNLFPLVDYYKGGGTSVAISPQINCLNNIITRVQKSGDCIQTLVHDKISDLSEAIACTVKQRDPTVEVTFEDSKTNSILQLADIICGLVLAQVKRILDGDDNVENIFLNIIHRSVNFVSSASKQEKLFEFSDQDSNPFP